MSEPTLPNPLPTVTNTPAGVLTGVEPPRALQPNPGQYVPQVEPPAPPATFYTADDIARARQQEKDKLYTRIEEMNEQLGLLKKERDERVAAEEAALKKVQEESEAKSREALTLKERLAQVETETEKRFRELHEERERERALLDKERSLLALTEYRNRRLNEERESILPELVDLISGTNEEEIEASITGLRERTERILEGARAALSTNVSNPGSRVTAPPAGPLDTNSEHRLPSPDEIRSMDINEYQKHRDRLLSQTSRNRGLFG